MPTEPTTEPRKPSEEQGAGALAPGTIVSRFVVIDRLGAGGMGVVMSAYDPVLDRKVALKVLRPRLSVDERYNARLLREAQAMARVSHRNVMTIHEVGTLGDSVFIAMELVDGETLASWLRRRRRWRETLGVFLQAGRGLAAAHRAGLVHRDFKPDNVMVARDGRALVTDFGVVGVARDADDEESPSGALGQPITREGTVMGTPGFMAPEQQRGEPVDARADQFSFCVALYQALVGQAPFEGKPSRVPRAIPGDAAMPRWMRPVVLRGLAATKEARFPSMDALLSALERGPLVTPGRAVGAAAIAAAAVAVGLLTAKPTACAGFDERLAGVWDPPTRGDVRRAFAAAAGARGADGAERVVAALDAYTRSWVAMRTEACQATSVRREQSAELLDRRMNCLDRRLESTRALVHIFARADGSVVDRAVNATAGLEPLDGCADAEGLLAAVPLPTDPVRRAWVKAMEGRIDAVETFHIAGKQKEAVALAPLVVIEARASGYAPALAEALGVYCTIKVEAMEADSEAVLTEAAEAAAAARNDRRTAWALGQLSLWLAVNSRHDEALALRPAIDAAVIRAGNGDNVRAPIDELLTDVFRRAKRYPEARQRAEGALRIRERHAEQQPYFLVRSLGTLAMLLNDEEKPDEALPYLERAMRLTEQHLGAQHPFAAVVLAELADTAYQREQWEQAVDFRRRALILNEQIYGPDSHRVALSLLNLGLAYTRTDLDKAQEHMERAVAALRRVQGPDHPNTAHAIGALGSVLAWQGKLAEAEARYRDQLAIVERTLPPDHPARGIALSSVGSILVNLGRCADALPFLRDAVVVLGKLPEDGTLGFTVGNAGYCELELGHTAAALPLLERGHALLVAHKHTPEARADTAFGLARALTALGRERERAVALAKEARDLYRASAHPDGPKEADKIDVWLRRR